MAEKSTQQNTATTVTAHARNLHIAPRKLRLVANLVKEMRAQDALVQLMFLNKRGASIVSKLISSAIANAEHNFSMNPSGLYIQSITCDGAAVIRRYMPRARGSASPLNRRMSHLHVVLVSKNTPAAKASRFSGLIAKKKSDKKSVDIDASKMGAPEITDARKPEVPKASDQIKQQKIQQKRRLFNRKSGE